MAEVSNAPAFRVGQHVFALRMFDVVLYFKSRCAWLHRSGCEAWRTLKHLIVFESEQKQPEKIACATFGARRQNAPEADVFLVCVSGYVKEIDLLVCVW